MKKVCVCLLTVALLLAALCGCSAKPEGEASVQSVAMICGLGTTGFVDRFAGIVSPRSETTIKKDENKVIDEIKVAEGDDVKKGQVLFTYDSEAAQLDLEKAQLELEQLKNTVSAKESEKAQLEKEKASAASSEQLSYSLAIQEADTAIREANYNAALKEKEIQKLEDSMQNLEVTSPVDGRVQSLNAEGGTDNYGNALPFLTVMETGAYRVKGVVNEANVSTISEGMQVLIRSRVDNTRTWSGTISKIDLENPQQGNNNTVSYDAGSDEMTSSSKWPFYVDLDSADGLLLGQHVYIEPDYGQEAGEDSSTIRMPSYYIMDAEGSAWVWAQNDKGLLEKRSVTLGDYDSQLDTYVIEAGLTAQDYIAYPEESLQSGMQCVEYDENTFSGADAGNGDSADSVPEDGADADIVPQDGFDADALPQDGGATDSEMEVPAKTETEVTP